jgi:transcriptional regulator with XRE-family HTH domain
VARRGTARGKSKLAPKEVGVCLRIREAREIAEVTQEKLSELIQIPEDRLSTYEKCRAPVRAEIGLRICRQLIISEEWLATGMTNALEEATRHLLLPMLTVDQPVDLADLRDKVFKRQCYDLLSEPIALKVPPGMLFTEAFSSYLAETYARLARHFFHFPRIVLTNEVEEPALASRIVRVIFEQALFLLGSVPAPKYMGIWFAQRELTSAIVQLTNKCYSELFNVGFDIAAFQRFVSVVERLSVTERRVQHAGEEKSPAAEKRLTDDYQAILDSSVRLKNLSPWKVLRRRLSAVTDRYGAKAALAREFRVTPQAVAEWLSGASAPTAETTLRLLEWVTAEEAKQKKAPEVRSTQPARKTRKKKARSNAKQKSSQAKH